jgi:hypothetical protein
VATAFQGLDHGLMRKDVKLCHPFALTFCSPVNPKILTRPALLTSRAMTFAARAICVSKPVKSPVDPGILPLLFHNVPQQR